jgi:UDP-N-acetylmuramoylalanine--D-glutamate ligase
MGLIDRRDVSLTGERLRHAIVGYGDEGQATLTYLRSKYGGDLDITVIDENAEPKCKVPKGVETKLGAGVLDGELDYDLLWRTPPIAPNRLRTRGQITSATQEFFDQCRAPIVGVTGTKGKGTTATLIHHILKAVDRTVHLVGNIGTPVLDILPSIKADDLVVFELSSFQLWDLKHSPHIAVVLMVEPEHLDVHASAEEYVQAKTNIVRWQGHVDVVIYHPTNPLTGKIALPGLGQKKKFLTSEGAYIADDYLIIDEHKICSIDEFGLLGGHNHENIAAAVTVAWEYTQDINAIATIIKDFKGLEHRLEFVREVNGAKYYNDSFGTTPATTIAAIKTFKEDKVLILGGSSKGADYLDMAKTIAACNVSGVVLIGDTVADISADLDRANYMGQMKTLHGATTMKEIVAEARKLARPGSAVLLSPACASFGLFENYKQRGELFKQAVNKL